MSPLNNLAAQIAGRRNAQPQSAQSDPNQNWNGHGQPQGQPYQGQPQHGQPQNGGYGQQQSFGQPSFTPAFQPMQEQAPQQQAPQSMPSQNGYAPQQDPYAQQRAYGQQPAQSSYQQQPQQQIQQQAQQQQAQQQQSWQQPDPRGFDVGSYMTPAQAAAAQAASQYRNSPYQQQAEFDQGYGHQGHSQGHGDWNQGQGHGQDMGFAQAAGGELDPNYGEEQDEYDGEDAPRGRRPLMIAAALAGAIFVGGGLAYSYKSIFTGADGGQPPVVKSAEGAPKAKPADAGGKQFAHTDSKIMGRLGDGNSGAASGDSDPNGTRKVATLVVGRDGSIQAPPVAEAQPAPAAAPAPASASGTPEVPGMMVVDAFSNNRPSSAAAAIAAAAPAAPEAPQAPQMKAPQKLTVAPPVTESAAAAPAKPVPVKIANAQPAKPIALPPAQTGSVEPAAAEPVAPAAPAPVKKPKVAAALPAVAAPAPAAPKSNSVATTGSGSNGFVAVLASVPRSGSSRMDALKRFADMQQKYGSVLAGKTPDVAEANLGAKGEYHRLVVGPPGSRDQASNVCTQLKSQGYGDCWVTAY